jgi:biopolymer transport protein ExbD
MAHTIAKKSTMIDMTAMCDMAFLILTFFILAATARPEEPVQITPPSSVSEFILPDSSIILTVNKEGKVFMDFTFPIAKAELIRKVNEEKGWQLTPEQMENFKNGASFGVPFSEVKGYLSLSKDDRKEYPSKGIPVDTNADMSVNELAYWITKARFAGAEYNNGKSPKICIKSDAGLKYPGFKDLISTLTRNKIYSFNLLTAAEAVPEGSALFQEREGKGEKK